MSTPLRTELSGGCRPWGFGATLLWGFAAIVAWLGFQIAVGEILAEQFAAGLSDPAQLMSDARFVATLTIVSVVVPLLVLALAVRRAGCSLTDYLGLRWPERPYVLVGFAALAVMIPLVDLFSWLAGYAVTPDYVLDIYRSARDSGVLLFLGVALVVAAPVVEETIFRGFLLPGLAQSAIGATGAILFTSVTWALLHAQYQPFYLIQIVVLGCVFGWLRLKSGSTVLTMVLHGILNFVAIVQAGIIADWNS